MESLEYYSDYNEFINEKIIYDKCFNPVNYITSAIIIDSIDRQIQSNCSCTKFVNYYNLDKSIMLDYIESIVASSNNYRKIIFEDNHSKLLEMLNMDNEIVLQYIINMILRYGKTHTLKLMLETYNFSSDEINTLLLPTIFKPYNLFVDMFTLLINHGAEIADADNLILSRAAEQGLEFVIKFLFDNGCDPNAKNGKIFCNKCWQGNVKIVELFLLYNVTDKNLNKGLIYAAGNGKYDIMKLLIENGADLQILNYITPDDSLCWLVSNNIDMLTLISHKTCTLITAIDKAKSLD